MMHLTEKNKQKKKCETLDTLELLDIIFWNQHTIHCLNIYDLKTQCELGSNNPRETT